MLGRSESGKEQHLSRFIDYFSAENDSGEKSKTAVREGKFVQIRNGNNQIVIFAPTTPYKYHSHIVAKFAEDMGLNTFEGNNGITFSDPGWKIVDGGKMRLNADTREVEIWGASQAYGQFDRTIEEELGNSNELNGYEISINL